MLLLGLLTIAHAQPKTRNVAKIDASSVSARKIAVRYTDGLKAFYSGNNEEALKVFYGIILDNPKHDASYYMLSKISSRQKHYHDAVDQLNTAIKLDKSNIWYKVDLAKTYMTMENWSDAAKLWETICKEKNNNEYYLYSLAECYYELNKPEKVIDTYNRMEKIMGLNDELTRVKVSLWLYMDNVKAAIGEYDNLIKRFPHNSDYYINAGNICQSNNMLDLAMTYYLKAAENDAQNPELNLTLSSYWEQKGDAQKQMQCLKRVFENPSVEMDVKMPYYRKLFNDAIRTRNESLMKNAADMATILHAAHPEQCEFIYFQAHLLMLQSQYNEALTSYESALNCGYSSYLLLQDYCNLLIKFNKLPQLLNYEQTIVELYPNNAKLLCYIGLAYLQNHQPNKALEYLNKAKSYAFEPSDLAIIYDGMSKAYQLIGDEEQANSYAKKAKQKLNQ